MTNVTHTTEGTTPKYFNNTKSDKKLNLPLDYSLILVLASIYENLEPLGR